MTPHFLDIIARRCVTDINEARKRINIIRGKYTYVPSKEYTQALKRYTLKGTTYKKSDYE